MRILIFLFFIVSSTFLFGQDEEIPKKTLKSPELLAHYLTDDIPETEEKVRAIYKWVISNIDYDYKSLSSDKIFETKKSEATLKSKKAICTGYVSLIMTMLEEINIKTENIPGYIPDNKIEILDKTYIDSHSWLAINIDGTWKLADPTWDAGYVGNMPKKVNEKKLKKKETKRVKKNKKREAKGLPLIPEPKKGEIEYTGNVGFVSDPKETWFLAENDSFLLKHLPLNPMWQLRSDTIGINTFAFGSDSLFSVLAEKDRKGSYLYEQELRKYLSFNFLDKLIYSADDGYDYYNKNYRVKAINYYNYLNILNNKKVKKEFEDLPEAQGLEFNKSMLVKIDTALFYSKLYDKSVKNRFKETKKFYSTNHKETKKVNKEHVKISGNNLKLNEEALVEIDKSNSRIKKENDKITEKLDKISEKYENIETYNLENISFSLTPIQETVDSMVLAENEFDKLVDSWQKRQNNSALQSILNGIEYSNYLLKYRKVSLEQKSIEYNNLIDTIDLFLAQNYKNLELLYIDSLKHEILSKEFYQLSKKIESFYKSSISLIKEKETSGEIKSSWEYINYLQAKVANQYIKMMKVNNEALVYNGWLEGYLNEFNQNWKTHNKLAGEQDGLSKKKLESMIEDAEHDYNRGLDLNKIIKRDSKKWQTEIKSRM